MDIHKSTLTASSILQGFKDYVAEFRKITHRAAVHFESQSWHDHQCDAWGRLDLYKRKSLVTTRRLKDLMGDSADSYEAWSQMKQAYGLMTISHPYFEIAETWYNSVCRKAFPSIGSVPEIMFTYDEYGNRYVEPEKPLQTLFRCEDDPEAMVAQILDHYKFSMPFQDKARDIKYIVQTLKNDWPNHFRSGAPMRVEMLNTIFYRNKGAYLVGRTFVSAKLRPFVLPILYDEDQLVVDTLVTDVNDLSIIFSFARSYFMVDVDVPSETVRFLKSIMPEKEVDELYSSIGFHKHGKTVMYRKLQEHLQRSEKKFIIAPGIRGMVMSVFTLPDYHIVFKLIKDKFDPPKTSTKAEVKAQYTRVKHIDRVGRMADTHEFNMFKFKKERFEPALLEELLEVAPSIVKVDGDTVWIHHLYTERKMIPLNMYLNDAEPENCEEVVGEYGNAIKQMAAANIFPGDMLLKNFGVTRHKRVVFYDYDEIGFLLEYNFRHMPVARDNEEMYASEAWFAVADNDIFPEEFRNFIIGNQTVKKVFFDLHDDLFQVKFWREIQQRIRNREVISVYPYRQAKRFSRLYAAETEEETQT